MIGRYAVLGRDICNIKYPMGCCSPNKEKEPGSAKLFFLWYNIIAKNIKPTKELYHKVDEITKGELLSKKITRLSSIEMQEPLELLEELNYIKIVEERTKRAVKPKTIIKVNPIIFYE